MEQVIIKSNPKNNTITTFKVSNRIENSGFILMYRNDKIVGFVYRDENKEEWTGESSMDRQTEDTLDELMDYFQGGGGIHLNT